MLFSNLVMYFIMLSTGTRSSTPGNMKSAAPLTPRGASTTCGRRRDLLFAMGVSAVGFLAVPVMTAGAAYDLAQTLGWKHSLHARLGEAKGFYGAMAAVTAVAIGLNFLGFNPMRALVLAGVVQGFSAPPLLILIMLITSDRASMGPRVNGTTMKVLGLEHHGNIVLRGRRSGGELVPLSPACYAGGFVRQLQAGIWLKERSTGREQSTKR